MPSWLLDPEWRTMLITSIFLLTAIVLLSVIAIVKKTSNNCSNGVLLDSRKNMLEMVVAILKDNAGNVAEKGFNNDDFIDTYEQSCEVMMANE